MSNITATTDAAANVTTTYSLTVGDAAQSQLAAGGDQDWYRIDLLAGQTDTFGLEVVELLSLILFAPLRRDGDANRIR